MEGSEPEAAWFFYLAHGLGNDYLVLEEAGPGEEGFPLTSGAIRRICDRREGLGADGIVLLLSRTEEGGVFPLRMFNPDGSEFERSGNGLRILASHLHRRGRVAADPFRVRTGGREVVLRVHGRDGEGRWDVSVEMGRARVGRGAVPREPSRLDGEGRPVHPEMGPVPVVPVSVGNPHVVVFPEEGQEAPLEILGPFLSRHPGFPGGVNVQLARVEGPERLRIGIWERGAGPTRASGTSSCAAVAAAVATDRLAPGSIRVGMEGGTLGVEITRELEVTLRGPVAEVAEGRLLPGLLAGAEGAPSPLRSGPAGGGRGRPPGR